MYFWPFISRNTKMVYLQFKFTHIPGGGAGKPIRDVPFLRVSILSLNSWTGYKNWSKIPKQVMNICSRTICHCFLLFSNLIIPKQSLKCNFFPTQAAEILKNGQLPGPYTHFSNPVPTVQFLHVFFGNADSTVQYLQFSLGPAYLSTHRMSVNTSLKKVSGIFMLEIFNECKNHFKSPSIKNLQHLQRVTDLTLRWDNFNFKETKQVLISSVCTPLYTT